MSDKRGKTPNTKSSDETIVSRAYDELKQPVSPAHLDEKILAQARRSVADPNNVVIEVQRWRKWSMPVALAATVVFAVPLVVRVFDLAPSGFAINDYETVATKTDSSDVASVISAERMTSQTSRNLDVIEPSGIVAAPARTPALLPNAEYDSQDKPIDARNRAEPYASLQESRQSSAQPDESDLAKVSADHLRQSGFADDSVAANDDSNGAALLANQAREARYAIPPVAAMEPEAAPRPTTAPAQRGANSRAERMDTASLENYLLKTTEQEPEYRRAESAAIPTDTQKDSSMAISAMASDPRQQPQQWLNNIAQQYRLGHIQSARRELGTFLTVYPEHGLPDDYPLRSLDALYDDIAPGSDSIVPAAGMWLRGIGAMAERGDIDLARTQLARFFRIYPDYPLPADFPLTRADALPIER